MSKAISSKIERLVKVSLAFHNLNKLVETKLGLSLVQYHVLFHVQHRPSISPHALAKVTGMHPSTLTQSLKRLNKRDLLYLGEHPRDSRRKIATLTALGKAALDRFESQIEKLLSSETSEIHLSKIQDRAIV